MCAVFHRLRRALVMAVSVLALSACGSTVTGHPVVAPPPAPEQIQPQTYGFDLIGTDVAALEILERVRRIDPCQVLPKAAVAELGTLLSYGAGSDLAECSAKYRPRGGDEYQSAEISFSLGREPYKPVKVPGFEREVLREDREATYGCEYYFYANITGSRLPSITPMYGKLSAINYSDKKFDGCAVLKPLMSAAMTALDARPARGAAGTSVKLATLDPCAFLGGMDRTGLRLEPGHGAYSCQVSRERGSGTVRFTASPPRSPSASGREELREVNGRQYFLTKLGETHCYARTQVGDEVEISTKDSSRPLKIVGTIEANHGSGNCDGSLLWAQRAADLATK